MQQPLLKRLIHNLIMRSCPAVFTVFLLPLLAVKPLAYIMINPTAADIEHHPYFHHPETTTHQLFSTSESISLEHIQDIINQMVHSMPEDTRHQAMLRKRSWFDGAFNWRHHAHLDENYKFYSPEHVDFVMDYTLSTEPHIYLFEDYLIVQKRWRFSKKKWLPKIRFQKLYLLTLVSYLFLQLQNFVHIFIFSSFSLLELKSKIIIMQKSRIKNLSGCKTFDNPVILSKH